MNNYKLTSLFTGFFTWLSATILTRFLDDYFFSTDNPLVLLTSFAAAVPALILITSWIINRYNLNKEQAITASVFMVFPGISLDVLIVLGYDYTFPNISKNSQAEFFSWILWANAIVLATAMFKKIKISKV